VVAGAECISTVHSTDVECANKWVGLYADDKYAKSKK